MIRYAKIFVMITVLFLLFHSCGQSIGERHNSTPKENATKPSRQKKLKIPEELKEKAIPTQNSSEKELKKKKQKASDTLKPKIAVLKNLE